MKATLTIATNTFPVDPTGLLTIKPVWEKSDTDTFYRLKPSGSLVFSRADFGRVQTLTGCCLTVTLNLYDCSNTIIVQKFELNSNAFEWEFTTCSAKVSTLTVPDDYRGVYKYWEKKVNICRDFPTITINHLYQVDATPTGETEKVYRTVPIANNRFHDWNKTWLFLIEQTFLGTEYAYLIPSFASYSTLFTAAINPISNSQNIFLRTALIQASDACEPASDNAATALNDKGEEVAAMCFNLKEVLEAFYVLFDATWYVDQTTHKLRIEHRLFFENGFSYTEPQYSLDLRQDRYKNRLKLYRGNYKTKSDRLAGIEEILLTGNQALNSSSFAFVNTYVRAQYEQAFGKVDDFDYGNIKYEFDCAPRDEKGALVRQTRSTDLFYTMLDSIQFNDPAIDRNKWFICEYVGYNTVQATTNPSNRGIYTPAVSSGLTFAVGPVERQGIQGVTNSNFSATSLMRVFHRHGRSFSSGLMNFSTTVSNKAGITRLMYSVAPTKQLQPITVDINYALEGFDPGKPLRLPDGTTAVVESARPNYWNNSLELNLLAQSSCGGSILPVNSGAIADPSTGTGGTGSAYPAKGTPLRTENFTVTCMSRGTVLGEKTAVRTYYADGVGGSYISETSPCTETTTGTPGTYNPNTPTRGPR